MKKHWLYYLGVFYVCLTIGFGWYHYSTEHVPQKSISSNSNAIVNRSVASDATDAIFSVTLTITDLPQIPDNLENISIVFESVESLYEDTQQVYRYEVDFQEEATLDYASPKVARFFKKLFGKKKRRIRNYSFLKGVRGDMVYKISVINKTNGMVLVSLGHNVPISIDRQIYLRLGEHKGTKGESLFYLQQI